MRLYFFRYETVTLVEGLNGPLNPQIGAVDSSNVSEQSEEPGSKATVREEQVGFLATY